MVLGHAKKTHPLTLFTCIEQEFTSIGPFQYTYNKENCTQGKLSLAVTPFLTQSLLW